MLDISSNAIERRMFFVMNRKALVPYAFRNIDVSGSSADYDFDRGDPDASRSGGSCLQAHQNVCHSSLPFFSALTAVD